jgi:hypothetical protein
VLGLPLGGRARGPRPPRGQGGGSRQFQEFASVQRDHRGHDQPR